MIDTSVITRCFIGDDDRSKIDRLLSLVVEGRIKLYAPQLIWYEFYSVIVKVYATKNEALKVVNRFENLLDDNVIDLINNTSAIERALEVAYSQASGKMGYIGTFDAYFHGTALLLNCPFLTNDEKHYNKTKDSFGNVILFKDLVLPE